MNMKYHKPEKNTFSIMLDSKDIVIFLKCLKSIFIQGNFVPQVKLFINSVYCLIHINN